jgi:sulfonate transport system substrate-binding protein
MMRISRRALAAVIAAAVLLPTTTSFAADALKEIRIDWATYNPVSLVLKQKGLLEKEFAKDGINVVWVQSAGSNKALEFLNAGSIDFGSTAGSAALVARINGNPISSARSSLSSAAPAAESRRSCVPSPAWTARPRVA